MNIKAKIYYNANRNNWTLNYVDPIDNKRIRKSFSTKEAAALYFEELKSNLIFGKPSKDGNKKTLNSIIAEYLIRYPNSKFIRIKSYTKQFTDEFGEIAPKEITPTLLRNWLIKIGVQNNYKILGLKTISKQIQILFQYMSNEGYIVSNPFKKIQFRGRIDFYKRNKLSQSDIIKILENLYYYSPYFLYRFIFTMYHTGLTMRELVNLKRVHFNYEQHQLTIVSPRAGCLERIIMISAEVADMLNKLPKRNEYLMCNRQGKKVDSENLSHHLFHFKECYPNTPEFDANDIRNATAFHFLENGGSLQELSKVLGHPSLHTTLNHYSRPLKIFKTGEADSDEEINTVDWGIQILD